jgi:nucleoid-associated protein YgaU
MVKVDFTSEFSQIIELDGAPGDSTFNIIIMLTNAYFDADQSPHNPDGRAIVTEIHAVAQCVASEKKNINYISDMYSTKYNLEQNIQDYNVETQSQNKVNAVFHGVLETTAPVGRVIGINVHAGAVAITPAPVGMTLRCPLYASAMFVSDDGRVMSSMRQYDIEANADIKEGSTCSAHAVCGREVYGVAVGNGIELRIPVDFNITETTQRQIRTLAGLQYDEDAPLDHTRAPSLVVYRTMRGDTLWQLAKKHNSTAKLILSANGLDKEENVAAGQLLIIPKKR